MNVDELYERWQASPADQKPDLTALLFLGIRKYVTAIVSLRLSETNTDLVQDILEATFEKLNTFRGSSKFSTWVYSVAAHKIIDLIRRRQIQAHRREIPIVLADTGGDALEDRSAVELADPDAETAITTNVLLLDIAEGLSEEEHNLFLGMLEGLDQNELAERLNCSPEAAQTRRRRFRQDISEKL